MSSAAWPIVRWYVLERGGVRYEVLAAGREQARWYLSRELRRPGGLVPGPLIRLLEGRVAQAAERGHDASPPI